MNLATLQNIPHSQIEIPSQCGLQWILILNSTKSDFIAIIDLNNQGTFSCSSNHWLCIFRNWRYSIGGTRSPMFWSIYCCYSCAAVFMPKSLQSLSSNSDKYSKPLHVQFEKSGLLFSFLYWLMCSNIFLLHIHVKIFTAHQGQMAIFQRRLSIAHKSSCSPGCISSISACENVWTDCKNVSSLLMTDCRIRLTGGNTERPQEDLIEAHTGLLSWAAAFVND